MKKLSTLMMLATAFGFACSDQQFTTNVDLSLRVIHISPSGNSESAPIDASIEVSFNQEIKETTVTSETVFLEDVTDMNHIVNVPTSSVYLPGNQDAGRAPRVTVTPNNNSGTPTPLGYSRLYRLTLTTGIERVGPPDGTLVANVQSVFRVVDPPPLYVLLRVPGPDDVQVPRATTLQASTACPDGSSTQTVVFSESVKQAQIDTNGDGAWNATDRSAAIPSLLQVEDRDTGLPIDGSLAFHREADLTECVEDTPCVLEFVPTSLAYCRWQYSQAVGVTLDGGLESERAARIENANGETRIRGTLGEDKDFADPDVHVDLDWAYRLEDPPALGLLDRLPSRAAQGIPLDTTIAMTFTDGIERALIDIDGTPDAGAVRVEYTDTCTPALYPDNCTGFTVLPGTFSFETVAGDTPNESEPPDNADIEGDDWRLVFTPTEPLIESRVVRVSALASLASDRATVIINEVTATRVRGTLGNDHDFEGTAPGADQVWTFRALDPPVLTVVSSTPGNGAKGVPTDTNVQVNFSEDLECASVTSSTFQVFDTTNAVSTDLCVIVSDLCATSAPTITVGGDRVQLIDTDSSGGYDAILCDPQPSLIGGGLDTDFAHSATVVVELDAGLGGIQSARASAFGGQLPTPPDPNTIAFEVVDRPPLLVLAATPSDGQQGVDPATPVVVRFDRSVNASTVTNAAHFFLQEIDGFGGSVLGSVAGTYAVSSSVATQDTVTFTPSAELEYEKTFRYTLTTDVCEPKLASESGGCLVVDYLAEFQVRSAFDLAVIAFAPLNDETGVPMDQAMHVTFSRGIDPTSIGDNGTTNPNEWNLFLAFGRTVDSEKAMDLAVLADCSAVGGGVLTVGGHFCVDGATVSFAPDTTADHFDNSTGIAGADGTMDWRFLTDYSLVAAPGVLDLLTPPTTLPTVFAAFFETQLSGLVQRIYLDPPGSVLGDFVFEFAEPFASTLNNGSNLTDLAVRDSAFWVEFVDRFGNSSPVPTSISFTDINGNACAVGTDCQVIRLSPEPTTSDCAEVASSLHYDTEYLVYSSALLHAADNDPANNANATTSPVSISTGAAPSITSVGTDNGVTTCTLTGTDTNCNRWEDDGQRVPVNSRLLMAFAADMLPASFVGDASPALPSTNDTDTVLLHQLDDDCTVALDLSYDVGTRTLSATPVAGGTCSNGIIDSGCGFDASGLFALQFDKNYALLIRGRSSDNPAAGVDPCDPAVTPSNDGSYLEACTSDGRYLLGNRTFAFRTSAANNVVLSPSPNGEAQACNSYIVGQFDRPVALDSLDTSSFLVEKLAGETGTSSVWDGAFTISEKNVLYISLPAFCDSNSANDTITQTVTPLVTDLLGNPFPTDTCRSWGTANRGNSEPQTTGAAPTSGATIFGHQRVGLCWGNGLQDRILPQSVNSLTLPIEDVAAGDLWAVAYETFKVNTDPTHGDYTFATPMLVNGAPDAVHYFLAGRTYEMTAVTFGIASVFNFAVDNTPGPVCGSGCTYTVETTRPNVIAASRDPVPDATDVSPRASVTVQFDEPIDPSSVVVGEWQYVNMSVGGINDPVLAIANGAPTGFFIFQDGAGNPVVGRYYFGNSTTGTKNENTMPTCGGGAASSVNALAFDILHFEPEAPLKGGTYSISLVDTTDGGCADYGVTPRDPSAALETVADTAGNCLAASTNNDWSFTVDTTPPSLVSTLPADLSGSPDITHDESVAYQFDEAMDVSLPLPAVTMTTFTARAPAACADGSDYTIGGCVRFGTGGSLNGGCEGDYSCDTAFFQAVEPFAFPTRPDIELDLLGDETADIAQNTPFADGSDLDPLTNIEVGDTVGPQVICVTPAVDLECGTPIAIPTTIETTFDDNVSVAAADVRLEDALTGMPVDLSGHVSVAGRVLTLDVTGILAAGTCYRGAVLTSVTDDDPAALLRTFHFGFVTAP